MRNRLASVVLALGTGGCSWLGLFDLPDCPRGVCPPADAAPPPDADRMLFAQHPVDAADGRAPLGPSVPDAAPDVPSPSRHEAGALESPPEASARLSDGGNDAGAPDPCPAVNCGDCVNLPGCGWCGSTNPTCVPGTGAGPVPPTRCLYWAAQDAGLQWCSL
jgi:hypothetical protein